MSTTILTTGMLLGVLQLAVGLLVGYWLARPKADLSGAADDRRRARRLTGELRTLTAGLSQQARLQEAQLGRVDERLQSEARALSVDPQTHPLTSLVSGVVREMLLANQQLQERLRSAELEIESQAAEITEHLQTAMTDPLTGLPNRRALDEHLKLRTDTWRKHQTPYSVVMLDVDHFKQFNDTHGHAAGDEALRAIGRSLREALRQHDVVTRYGGEEFAIILPHTTLRTAQAAVVKALQAVRDNPVLVRGTPVPVTASAGMASVGPSERPDALLSRADDALYAAKKAGRDQAWLNDGAGLHPLDCLSQPDASLERQPESPSQLALSPDLAEACSALSSSLSALVDEDSAANAP